MTIEPGSFDGILFDLDGTFADTAGDLAYALNQTLAAYGRDPLPLESIRSAVSHGGTALIKLGFNIQPESRGFEEKRRFLLDIYQDNICRETRLFEGIEQLITELEEHGLPWGIVTNKPSWLTDPLMDELDLTHRASTIVSGDTCEKPKPHPTPILHACEEMQVQPSACVYVGDAERDILAGRAAGSPTVVAMYGYLLPEDQPESWNADSAIQHPGELSSLMIPK